MKKFNFKYLLLVLFIIPCLLLAGCFDNQVYVTSIKFDSINGDVANYIITYSNGTTSTLSVTNGKDGKDVSVEEIFAACVERGLYANNENGFKQFLKDYLKTSTSEQQQMNYRAMQSIVGIYCSFEREYISNSIDDDDINPFNYYEFYAGSGIIYDSDADQVNGYTYILTNSHVVNLYESTDNKKLPVDIAVYQYGGGVDISVKDKIEMSEDEKYILNYDLLGDNVMAECIGYEVNYDTAVLRVKTSELLAHNSNFRVADVCTEYVINEKVAAIGNPLGDGVAITEGEVSYPYDTIKIAHMSADNKEHIFNVIRFSAPIYGGNSGGGLFNAKGQVIGLVNAGLTAGDNHNAAIPIQAALNVAANLRYYYTNQPLTKTWRVTSADLGIIVTNKNKNFNQTTGTLTYDVLVSEVKRPSIASIAGLRTNDVIQKVVIDGQETTITHSSQLDAALLNARSNSVINLVLKSGSTVTINSFILK